MGVVYHPAARRELRDAASWSDAHFGRGAELDEAVRQLEGQVDERPRSLARAFDAPAGRDDVRQARVEGFPYRLVILVRAPDRVVLAVAHTARRPGYWQRRLRS